MVSLCHDECMGKEDKIGNEASQWARAKVSNSNETSIGRAIVCGCTTHCHLSVHSLAHPRSDSGDDFRGWGPRSRRCSSGEVNHSKGGGVPVSALSLAGFASRDLGADGCLPLNAFLVDAVLRVVCNAVPVQAAASASVVPSASARGVDADVSGGLDAGGAGRVITNVAACRGNVDFGAAAARSSGGAAVFQVMNPVLSGIVPSSLVDGTHVSSNHLRPEKCLAHSTFTPPPLGIWGA